jgi:hypothetical protein
METQVTKEQMVLSIRNGVEIYIDKDKMPELLKVIQSNKFIKLGDSMINTADISGIFTAEELESSIRRKNGQWKDKKGVWHDKGERICPHCGQVLPYGMKCGNCQG